MRYGSQKQYETDEGAKALVDDGFEESYRALKDTMWPKWKRNEYFYHSKHDASLFKNAMGATHWLQGSPYRSHIFLPVVMQQVETQVPRICLGLLANDPLFVAKPILDDLEEQTQAERDAKAVERTLHAQCVRDIRIRRQLPIWGRDAVLHGTQPLFVEWHSRRGSDWEMEPEYVQDTVNGQRVKKGTWKFTEKQDQLLEDRIRVTAVSLFDFFPDPRGQTLRSEHGRQCRYVIRRVIMTMDDLWAYIKATPAKPWWWKGKSDKQRARAMVPDGELGKKAYKQLEELMGQVKGEDNMTATIQAEVGRLADSHGEGWTASNKQDRRLLCIYDYWEPSGGYHIMVVGTRAKGLLLLREKNPYKKLGLPFVMFTPVPKRGSLWGIGVVDAMADGQLVHHVNALTNLHMTSVIHGANPVVLIDATSGLTKEEMISQPFTCKETDGSVKLSESMHMQPYPSVDGLAVEERDYAMRQLVAATGSDPAFSSTGQTTSKNPTARGIGYFLEQNNQRFNLQVHMSGESMCELGECAHLLNQQFLTRAHLVRFTNAQGQDAYMPVTPDMLKRAVELEFDARPEAANPGLRIQQFDQWAAGWMKFPQVVDLAEIALEGARLRNLPRPQRFLRQQRSVPEMENEIFRQTGRMPPVSVGDNHGHHRDVHQILFEDGSTQRWQSEHETGGEVSDHLRVHMNMEGIGGGGQQPQGQPGAQPPMGAMAPEVGPRRGGGTLPPIPRPEQTPMGATRSTGVNVNAGF